MKTTTHKTQKQIKKKKSPDAPVREKPGNPDTSRDLNEDEQKQVTNEDEQRQITNEDEPLRKRELEQSKEEESE